MKNYSRYYTWGTDFIALTEAAQVAKINDIFDALRGLRTAVTNKITAYGQAAATTPGEIAEWTTPTLIALETALLVPVEDAADAFETEATT